MPERLHILFYDYVPDMAERRGPYREGHLALIARWHEEGRVAMAGALGVTLEKPGAYRLGAGRLPGARDIDTAIRVMRVAAALVVVAAAGLAAVL